MSIYLTALLAMLNQVAVKGSKMLVALYAIELGASPLAIGALVSTYAVFPLVLAVYAGRVSDRRGVRGPMSPDIDAARLNVPKFLVRSCPSPSEPTRLCTETWKNSAAVPISAEDRNSAGNAGSTTGRTSPAAMPSEPIIMGPRTPRRSLTRPA